MNFDYTRVTASKPLARLVLAHGAGAGKQSDFMQDMAVRLTARQLEVVLFDFPYMQTLAATGKRRPPDKAERLLDHYAQLLAHLQAELPALPTCIGGKSMGGRMATMLLEDSSAHAAVVFGYPFHPPGKPDKLRTEHLQADGKPVCIVQGARDTFGTEHEIDSFGLHKRVQVHCLADGDHSLKPRKASGFTHTGHLDQAASLAADFVALQVHA